MKKYRLILSMLAVLLCVMSTGCSSKDTDISSIFGDALPDKITSIEVSGYYNGGVLEPWELTREEIEELSAWLSELSLKHRTYAEGETLIKYGTVERLISSMSMMENCPSHGQISTWHIFNITASGMKL